MRTKPRGRPVLSSIVFQRPSGKESAAKAAEQMTMRIMRNEALNVFIRTANPVSIFCAAIAESFRGLYKFATDGDHLMKGKWQLDPSLLSPGDGGDARGGSFGFLVAALGR